MKSFVKYIVTALILTIAVYVLLQLLHSHIVENEAVELFLIIVVAIFYYKWRRSIRLKESFITIQFIDA